MILLCYLQSLKKYLSDSTINVGLQIVDVDLSRKYVSQNGNPPVWSTFTDSGKSIAGVFDTINGLCGNVACGQPLDVIAYKSGYVLMTTMPGNLMILDVNTRHLPVLQVTSNLSTTPGMPQPRPTTPTLIRAEHRRQWI